MESVDWSQPVYRFRIAACLCPQVKRKVSTSPHAVGRTVSLHTDIAAQNRGKHKTASRILNLETSGTHAQAHGRRIKVLEL